MAGSVDMVIKDNTISRIHARITRQKDGVYVTDIRDADKIIKIMIPAADSNLSSTDNVKK